MTPLERIAVLQEEVDMLRGVVDYLAAKDLQIAALTQRIAELEAQLPPPFVPDIANRLFAEEWSVWPAPGWELQAMAPDRASVVTVNGQRWLRLLTKPGDNNVAGSGAMERCDVYRSQVGGAPIYHAEGAECWLSYSLMFPDEFQFPHWHRYALGGFHHEGATGGGNMSLAFEQGAHPNTEWGWLGFILQGQNADKVELIRADSIVRNQKYEFVHHIRFSSSAGYNDAWLNGKRVMAYKGATLYPAQRAYLKLANYHTPVCDPYPACIGTHKESAILHGPVFMGSTWRSVASGPLEGLQ